jgi:hypothetical protein
MIMPDSYYTSRVVDPGGVEADPKALERRARPG